MFGWLKKQAPQVTDADVVSAAVDDAQRVFLTIQGALGGVDPGMPDDAFLAGVLASHAAILATVVSGGRCSMAVTEGAMIGTLETAFAEFGIDRPRAVELLLQFKSQPAYVEGVNASTLILAARFGRDDLKNDTKISGARSRVRSMPKSFRKLLGSTEVDQVEALLCRELVTEPMKTRYGEIWKRRQG